MPFELLWDNTSDEHVEPIHYEGKITFGEPELWIQLDKTLRLPRKQKKRLKKIGEDWKRIAFNNQLRNQIK